MTREEIISNINAAADHRDLTILKNARFKKQPLRALYFYTLVALNRYTPLLIPIQAITLWKDTFIAYETSAVGSIYFLGFYDSEITLFLLKNFKEQGDLLDIGSNIGYYASLFSFIASTENTVYAFEPTPSTFSLLEKNVGGHSNVRCEKIAISEQNGETTFHDYGYRHGVFNSTAEQPIDFLQGKGKEIIVKTKRLDDWCSQNSAKPSLIKLDTEGTEAGILRNASHTLSEHTPVVLLEVGGGDAWSKNNNDSLDILATHGYEFYTADESGDLLPHTRQSSYQYTNIIAVHSTKKNLYVTNN